MSSTSMRLLPKNSPKCGVPNYWDALLVLSGKKGFFLPIAPKAKYAAVCSRPGSPCIALPARPEERERYCRPYAFLPKTGNIPHIKNKLINRHPIELSEVFSIFVSKIYRHEKKNYTLYSLRLVMQRRIIAFNGTKSRPHRATVLHVRPRAANVP